MVSGLFEKKRDAMPPHFKHWFLMIPDEWLNGYTPALYSGIPGFKSWTKVQPSRQVFHGSPQSPRKMPE
jgi:hypothetical protein